MNKCVMIGRIVRDPDIRQTQSEMTVARFSIAVDRRTKGGGADFPSCVAFGKVAESIGKWLKKGTKVAVEGRLQTGSYTNKDGRKVYTCDVIVESWEFCERKGAEESAATDHTVTDDDGFSEDLPEDLPFN